MSVDFDIPAGIDDLPYQEAPPPPALAAPPPPWRTATWLLGLSRDDVIERLGEPKRVNGTASQVVLGYRGSGCDFDVVLVESGATGGLRVSETYATDAGGAQLVDPLPCLDSIQTSRR